MDQHERIWRTDDGCIILFVHFAVFFPVLSPLLDIVLESITLGYFGAPSEEGNYITTPSPAFDIPKSWSIIPDFKNNPVESCCGTFTWSDWYYSPFIPYSGTLWPLSFSRLWMVTWRLHLSL